MLSIEGLTKSYADKRVLDAISFSVEKGEVVALLGANGSGKTTTVQSICRLIEWDSGEVFLNSISTKTSDAFLKQIGAVLGGCRNTNWRLTAKQNADYFARLRGFSGKSVTANIERLHTQLGLDPHQTKEVMKLSTGNKQKAALLCAMGYSPEYVLLDEPTLGLDFATVEELQTIIATQASQCGQGFLITSHDLGFIDSICDKVVVLDHGKLLFEGSINQLRARLFSYQLQIPLSDTVTPEVIDAHWQGRFAVNHHCDTLCVQFDEPAQCLPFMSFLERQKVRPKSLNIEPLSVEKAYQALVQQQHQ